MIMVTGNYYVKVSDKANQLGKQRKARVISLHTHLTDKEWVLY